MALRWRSLSRVFCFLVVVCVLRRRRGDLRVGETMPDAGSMDVETEPFTPSPRSPLNDSWVRAISSLSFPFLFLFHFFFYF